VKKKIRSVAVVLSDIFLLSVAFLLSYFIRFDFSIASVMQEFYEELPLLLIASVAIKLVVFTFFKLYHSLWKYASIYEF